MIVDAHIYTVLCFETTVTVVLHGGDRSITQTFPPPGVLRCCSATLGAVTRSILHSVGHDASYNDSRLVDTGVATAANS